MIVSSLYFCRPFSTLVRKHSLSELTGSVRAASKAWIVTSGVSDTVVSLTKSPKLVSIPEVMMKSYGDAVVALNGLQSNAAVVSKIKKERDALRHENIPNMIRQCQRVGISLEDLDRIPVIHVSGTKGKGSVCALCESILRQSGLRTGFYSSPHLIEVRERIRINGRPISGDKFSNYFWDVYDHLMVTQRPGESDMPAYFRFLTIMAFHVFLAEKVDVAVVEVGLGGEYDCTNIIRKPVVCGISSLGIDHVDVLGDTISKIAWQKAGILKTGCPVITVPQPEEGLDVIAERAKEKQSPLSIVPDYTAYNWQGYQAELGIDGPMQKLNASLAIQLCTTFLERHKLPMHERITPVTHKDDFHGAEIATARALRIPEQFRRGLENCQWPGRNQVIKKPKVSYYLDGAHTKRSMAQCVDWFREESQKEGVGLGGRVARILIFNFTGDRQAESLLKPLMDLRFDAVAFCPNVSISSHQPADLMNYMTTSDKQMERCTVNREAWRKFEADLYPGHPVPSQIFTSVGSSLAWCAHGDLSICADDLPPIPASLTSAEHVQILITGSLHLIGCALRILDPDMNDRDPPGTS